MSAYLCSPIHLAALAREMTRRIVVAGESPNMARAAVDAEASVYAAQHLAMRRLDLVRLYGVLQCYEYQSCEHPGWESSAAHGHCEAMRQLLLRALVYQLAAQTGKEPGWSLDDKEVLA